LTVDLYWLPLGAGGRCVRLNGRAFEAVSARRHHRAPRDLYHSALRVGEYAIEMAPVWNERARQRGVVTEGPVGSRRLGRWRLFRYEIRCWRGGRIPDIAEAVDSPRRLSDDPAVAAAIVRLVPDVPALVWGRDELRTGDMWNSNSVTAWLLAGSGLDAGAIHPPAGGRAPGWDAGLAAAQAFAGESSSSGWAWRYGASSRPAILWGGHQAESVSAEPRRRNSGAPPVSNTPRSTGR
jgi:hypothetical protein